ncbi:methyltransferase type 12 [Achromatium sp. WMS2]|nr:methyltransferase type 12 [Achromatium sp. WMS2]
MNSNDIRIILHLLRGQSRTGSHAERLEAFYAPQAKHYDAFRERLLQGRRELIELLNPAPGARIIELGGGTGHNIFYFGDKLKQLESIEIVDLCPALLKEANLRTQDLPNVRIVEADATTYKPNTPADYVYFSYAITMIPDWKRAIENAISILAPGGTLGIVDFYVSTANPPAGAVKHGIMTRTFWPRWFAHDGVRLNPEHLTTLRHMLPKHQCFERRSKVPYLLGLQVPYYIFVGQKP